MSEERLTNYVIFVIMDCMLEAFENNLDELRLQFLDMRKKPECLSYVVNWVKAHKSYLRRADTVLHNPELERLTLDGVRLCHAHYYTNDRLIDGTTTSAYAKEMSEFYKSDIAGRE